MSEHLKVTIELTAHDADDIERYLLARVAAIDRAMATVRRKRSWAASVKAATLASYEIERRTLSALQMNIQRGYVIAKAKGMQS